MRLQTIVHLPLILIDKVVDLQKEREAASQFLPNIRFEIRVVCKNVMQEFLVLAGDVSRVVRQFAELGTQHKSVSVEYLL